MKKYAIIDRAEASIKIHHESIPIRTMPLWERYSAAAAPSMHTSQFCKDNDGNVTSCAHAREKIWTDVYTNQMCYVPPKDTEMVACHDTL